MFRVQEVRKELKMKEPSKDNTIEATKIIRNGRQAEDFDADDWEWAIKVLIRAFRNGYDVVKTS